MTIRRVAAVVFSFFGRLRRRNLERIARAMVGDSIAFTLSVRRRAERIAAMKITAILFALAALALATNGAEAKGCLKGAAVGGAAGHFAGHHGMLGAAAGCLYGHHRAKEQEKQQEQQQPQQH
jgi:hypothetical protein